MWLKYLILCGLSCVVEVVVVHLPDLISITCLTGVLAS